MALILFDSFALLHGGRSLWRGVAAHRRVAATLPVVGTREIGGRSVRVVPGASRARSAPGSCARACTCPRARSRR